MTERLADLVSTAWLENELGAADLRILAAGVDVPGSEGAARRAFDAARLPGAVYFDIDRVADAASFLPHMLPDADAFARAVAALGIGDGDRIVVYDSLGLAAATRVWWSFRVFGHEAVAVLDGGLRAWGREGRTLEVGPPRTPLPASFTARFRPELVRDRAGIEALIGARDTVLVDARSASRFDGTAPEIWPGRRQGHIPGSRNLDHTRLWDAETGRLADPATLRAAFVAAGVPETASVVATCGSGITASVLAFALHQIGREAAIYDGSWAEWGLPDGPPIELGPARDS